MSEDAVERARVYEWRIEKAMLKDDLASLAKERDTLAGDRAYWKDIAVGLEDRLASLTEENDALRVGWTGCRQAADYLRGELKSLIEENERHVEHEMETMRSFASERARAEEAEGNTREFANKLAEVVGEREGLRQSLSEAEQRATSNEKALRHIASFDDRDASGDWTSRLSKVLDIALAALSPIDPPLAQGNERAAEWREAYQEETE
jgi:chromosome segregation ATPase